MKKNIMLVVLLSVLVFTVGCNSATLESNSTTNELGTQASYKLNNELYIDEDKHIEIHYPKVIGYKDSLVQDFLNQSIKEITEIYGYYSKYKYVEISYDIEQKDNETLCIVFTGTAKSDGELSHKVFESLDFDLVESNYEISFATD